MKYSLEFFEPFEHLSVLLTGQSGVISVRVPRVKRMEPLKKKAEEMRY
jgi:hypothetical protein